MKVLISCNAKLKPTHILWPAAKLFQPVSERDCSWDCSWNSRHVLRPSSVLHLLCIPSVWIEDLGVIPAWERQLRTLENHCGSRSGTNQILGFMCMWCNATMMTVPFLTLYPPGRIKFLCAVRPGWYEGLCRRCISLMNLSSSGRSSNSSGVTSVSSLKSWSTSSCSRRACMPSYATRPYKSHDSRELVVVKPAPAATVSAGTMLATGRRSPFESTARLR